MKQMNMQIDRDDLKLLFFHSEGFKSFSKTDYNTWEKECRDAYKDYFKAKKDPKTFSQWVNGQIIALT